MFAVRYFAATFFAPRYFAETGATVAIAVPTSGLGHRGETVTPSGAHRSGPITPGTWGRG